MRDGVPAVKRKGTVPWYRPLAFCLPRYASAGSVPLFELENLFDGFAEDPGDLQCQYRRGDEAPGLDGVYGLAAYADGIGQLLWVMRTSARSTRILFFIAERFVKPVHGHAEKQVVDGRDGVQQYEHAGQELEVVETQCQQDQ